MKFLAVLLLFLTGNIFAAEPFRTIAILENERMIEAEPDIRLADYFRSASEPVRIRAVLAAARIGNPVLLAPLKSLIHDQSVDVRKHVAFAVGQIRSKEGISIAVPLLKDRELEVRRLAIDALGRIGGLETTALITPFLRDKNPILREQSALSLALVKDKATVVPLLELLASKDPVQWSYVYALYRLADERSISSLHKVLSDPVPSPSTGDPSSLLFALKALWGMKKPITSQETERFLEHKDARVQQNALDVIAASADKTACPAIHRSYPAMVVLSKVKALETMGALGCVIEQRPATPGLLGAWLSAQAKAQKEKSLALLEQGASHQNWTVRWRTAQGLGELPAGNAIPLLKKLSQDPDSAVRLAALDSLTKYMPETADVFTPLLQHQDFATRATAIDALGKTKDPKYLPVLLKMYEAHQDPTEIEGRTALLAVLAEFNSSDALPVFERAILDPEFTIRRHAIDGLKKLVGTAYHSKEGIIDPEEFLHLKGRVMRKRISEYPADFGQQSDPVSIAMKLEKGEVVIRLLGNDAPLHADNFRKLVEQKFYDGLRIYRVVPNFVIQGGDPRGDGWGGAGTIVHDQINFRLYKRGMIGMPIAGKDTGGSQFFITHSRQPHLDGNYTIFGEVISGMDVVDRTEVGDQILSAKVVINAKP